MKFAARDGVRLTSTQQEWRIPGVPRFRYWTAECSDAPREVYELALAHVNSDSVEAAYRRSDLFERRGELMEQWAAFLAGTEDKVVWLSG